MNAPLRGEHESCRGPGRCLHPTCQARMCAELESTPAERAAIAEWTRLDAIERKEREAVFAALRKYADAALRYAPANATEEDESEAREEMLNATLQWREAELDVQHARELTAQAGRR